MLRLDFFHTKWMAGCLQTYTEAYHLRRSDSNGATITDGLCGLLYFGATRPVMLTRDNRERFETYVKAPVPVKPPSAHLRNKD